MNSIRTDAFRDALERIKTLQADVELFADGDVRTLNFVGTTVEDDDLATVAVFSRLERLYLGATRVTDAGLKHLLGLKNLEYLSLHGTEVSELRRQQLRLLLPNCRVCPRSDLAATSAPVIIESSVSAASVGDAMLPREILRRMQALETDVTELRRLIEQHFANQ